VGLIVPERRDAVSSGSPTYNPFENPSTPLASVGFDNVWSTQNNDSGELITTDRAMGIPTVFRCVNLMSTVVASCPLQVYRGHKKEDVTHLHKLLSLYNPDMTYTQFELMELIVVYLCLWGNAFIYKKRDSYGEIIDLKPLSPDLVEVKLDEDGNKIFEVTRVNADGTPNYNKPPEAFTDRTILHIPGIGYNGREGMSPIRAFGQTLGTAMAGDRLAARFYSRGTQLGGIVKIKVPLKDEAQAEGIKRRWQALHGGVVNAGDVAVLDAESDFQDITIPPDSLQFLESRRWQTTEIARWFGIPPHLIGDVEKSTSWGSGIEQQNLGLVTYSANGWFCRIEQRYTREIVGTRGHIAEFNVDRLMRGSTVERYTALSQAVGGPWLSVNEARISENRQPKGKKHDQILPPQGVGPLDNAQQAGQNNKQPQQGQ
jgi:HK97 family phage portal protein